LGFEEYRTSEIVANYLEKGGLNVKRGIAKTGLVALLEENVQSPTLLLCADMDALPIQEENEVPYRSINNGVMHACGHDAHTAILLVAAKILSGYQEKIKGNVKFVFQPNEEIGGAKVMIEEGILENPQVNAAMALHLWMPLESGTIGVVAGPATGALDIFTLEIEGKGGAYRLSGEGSGSHYHCCKYYSDHSDYTNKRNKRVRAYYYYVYQNKKWSKIKYYT